MLRIKKCVKCQFILARLFLKGKGLSEVKKSTTNILILFVKNNGNIIKNVVKS